MYGGAFCAVVLQECLLVSMPDTWTLYSKALNSLRCLPFDLVVCFYACLLCAYLQSRKIKIQKIEMKPSFCFSYGLQKCTLASTCTVSGPWADHSIRPTNTPLCGWVWVFLFLQLLVSSQREWGSIALRTVREIESSWFPAYHTQKKKDVHHHNQTWSCC